MEKSYYIEYFKLERENWWFKARLEIIKAQVAKIAKHKGELNILNVGAATGATSLMLQAFGKVTSIEYDQDCLAFIKDKVNIHVEHGSILELNFANNSFDLVCAFDVIEHVENDKLAAEELTRVCKPNGQILVTVPAFMFLWSKHDEINHHFKRYTKPQFTRLFSKANVKYATYFNSLLFFPIVAARFLLKFIPIKRSGAGSDFNFSNSTWQNNLLYPLFKAEKLWLNNHISVPFGVSVMALLTKNE